MKIRMVRGDGSEYFINYKPTSRKEQSDAYSRWLIKEGGRAPSEAAMEVSTMSEKKLRRMYKNLVIVGKVVQ